MNEYVPKTIIGFFLIDFSPFSTGCDYRNYENDINIFFKIWILVVLIVNKYK